MKRRSLIVNSLATTMVAGGANDAIAAASSVRSNSDGAHHLGLHRSVWNALADRVGSVLEPAGAVFCGQRTAAEEYRSGEMGEGSSQSFSWRLHTGPDGISAPDRSVLVCTPWLATRAGQLAALRATSVTSVGGVALYFCEGAAGEAVLMLPALNIPPRILAVTLNES